MKAAASPMRAPGRPWPPPGSSAPSRAGGVDERRQAVGQEGGVVRGHVAGAAVDDAAMNGSAVTTASSEPPRSRSPCCGKAASTKFTLRVVDALLLQPGAEAHVQEGAQARHADLLADAVLRRLDAASRRAPPGRCRSWSSRWRRRRSPPPGRARRRPPAGTPRASAAHLQRVGLRCAGGMTEFSGMNLGSTSRLRFVK